MTKSVLSALRMALFTLVLAPVMAWSALSHAQETVEITDTEGRTVSVPHGAQRVLLGFYFEDFYAIVGADAYDRVVAISRDTWEGWRNTQWQAYLAVNPKIADLIDIGEVDAGTFNIEAAIAAKPDVALLAAWQYRALGDAIGKLEAAGIPVVVVDYNAQTVEKHVLSTQIIGTVMAVEERAERLANEYQSAVADVLARVAASTEPAKRVYVELGNKGPEEYGNSYAGVMWGGVITMAGGENIADGKIERWSPLNPEYVVASQPDVVLIQGSGWVGRDKAVLLGFGIDPAVTRERLSPYLERSGWASLPAVAQSQVHSVYHGGARTLYDYAFLQYIAKILHPEAFADVDPEANHRRFYETYLPIEADGAFMVQFQ